MTAEPACHEGPTPDSLGCEVPFTKILSSDARDLAGVEPRSVDLVVTSPPYWKKRDYGIESQIGQEKSPEDYVAALIEALREWRRVLRRSGSVFLNIGDTYWKRSLAGVPGLIETAARQDGWILRNRIIWAKNGGMPDPAQNRLAPRHEFILHLTLLPSNYYYDLFGYSQEFGNGSNPGDVWNFGLNREMTGHLAPFPEELVERVIIAACPGAVCRECSRPRRRIIKRTNQLDLTRPQARRAMELAKEAGLTDQHIAAIQATGISDAGKALKIQNGTGRNTEHIKKLASEAKTALGGYFREFTFSKRITKGWTRCKCGSGFTPGVVLDPFMGSGTTLRVAARLQRSAIGSDLMPTVASRREPLRD